jgi:hypothetical protein
MKRRTAFGTIVVLALVGLTSVTSATATVPGVAAARAIATALPAAVRAATARTNTIVASPPTWGTFSRPSYGEIAFGPDGTLYTTDCGNARVYRISRSGRTSVFAGAGPGGFTQFIRVKGLGWTTVAAYGGDGQHATDALFKCILGIAFDADGNMFVSDHLNSRIREIDTAGFVSTVAGVGPGFNYLGPWTQGIGPEAGDGGPATHGIFDAPWDITFDAAGNLFIADRDHDAIREVDTNGILTTVAGTGHAGYNGDDRRATTARLSRPVDVAFDAAGAMYISDEDNVRIREVVDGTISTFAGSGRHGCGGDGHPAIRAAFKNPGDIVFAPDGSLLISDGECFRIRRVAPDGTISTYAGNGKQGCGGVGKDVSKLHIDSDVGLRYGPDGDLYIVDCDYILRVDASGTTHLVATAPKGVHDP